MILALLATFGGVISLPGNSWLNDYLSPLFTKVAGEEHHLGATEYTLMGVAVLGGLLGILIAYIKYFKQNNVPEADENITGVSKVLYNKYYVDEIYDAVFVRTINALSKFSRDYIETGLSAVVFGLGKVTNELAFQGKKL
jgi:NADH-quinone oxidoreductase subunit L